MRVVIARAAFRDLDAIYGYLDTNRPSVRHSVALQFGQAFRRLGEWPKSGQMLAERDGIRIVVLVKYPYKIYYRIGQEFVEIIHVYHTSRDV